MRFYSNEFHSPNNVSALNIEVRDLIEGTRPVPNLAVNATISTVPEKIMVYTAIRGIDREEFHRMANEIGIRGEAKEESGYIIVQNDKYQLDAELSSGVVNYKNNLNSQGTMKRPLKKIFPVTKRHEKLPTPFLLHGI